MKKLGLLALVIIVVLAGAVAATAADAPKEITLTAADQGKTVNAKVGQIIRVELGGNLTTGYNWNPVQVNAEYLEMLSPENIESAPAGMVGAPSLIVTRFKAKKPGSTAVDLGYFRPWESPATAADHFRFNLVIKP